MNSVTKANLCLWLLDQARVRLPRDLRSDHELVELIRRAEYRIHHAYGDVITTEGSTSPPLSACAAEPRRFIYKRTGSGHLRFLCSGTDTPVEDMLPFKNDSEYSGPDDVTHDDRILVVTLVSEKEAAASEFTIVPTDTPDFNLIAT